MSDGVVQQVDLANAVPRPGPKQIAHRGPRRLVKFAPVMHGVPVIWRSPDPVEDHDEEGKKISVYQCVVLVQKQPKPETMLVNIPVELYDRLQDVPVEW